MAKRSPDVKLAWSKFPQPDGNVIWTRLVLRDVRRTEGEFDTEGNPAYTWTWGMECKVKAPKRLRRAPQG